MQLIRRRPRAALLAVILVLSAGGVAYAYWTTSGSGSGQATTGNAQSVTVNQTSTVSGMYPGDSPQTLSGNFTNTNGGPVYVGTVTASISSVTLASGVTGTCDASDYTLSPTTATVNAQVPAGTGVGSWSGPQIKFNNKTDTNQNACKGATVNLSYAVTG